MGIEIRILHSDAPLASHLPAIFLFFFFTLVTAPRRSLSLKLSDTRVYEPQIKACLGTTAHPRKNSPKKTSKASDRKRQSERERDRDKEIGEREIGRNREIGEREIVISDE
jgi:hypothetical protein